MLLETLRLQSGIPTKRIATLARTASARYKVYYIPKRDGGERKIEHPSRELKALQRWVNAYLIQALPQHPNATAYSKGSSIRANAARHLGTRYTVRIDLKDFFPSFREVGVRLFLREASDKLKLHLTPDDIVFVSKVVCRNGALTIGSPTSPALSNRMMFDFDSAMTLYAEQNALVYTRYADDMFVSSYHPYRLAAALEHVKVLLSQFRFAKLKINGPKTVFLSRKFCRRITGIVVTPDGHLSVGRASKRHVRSLVFKHIHNTITAEEQAYMRGYLAYLRDVEPRFVEALVVKYGKKNVSAAITA